MLGTMPIEIRGETYYTATEAASYLGIARSTFYLNVQPHLREYKHGALRRVYYRQSELDQYSEIREQNSEEE